VDVNSFRDLDIKLAVGAADQKIEAAAVAPLVETQGADGRREKYAGESAVIQRCLRLLHQFPDS
jgi:hypothetical protein